MPFNFTPLAIPGLALVEPQRFGDARGFFMETYKKTDFAAGGIHGEFVQDNVSYSSRGVLRGLHYQLPPQAQAKLVTVYQGEVFDVAVDIRQDSPSYGQWHGLTLSSAKPQFFYIPTGFAHGYCVLSETAIFAYKVDAEYAPELDRGIMWNDPSIGIEWPIQPPLLSDKDKEHPPLSQVEKPFTFTA
jgi:dTDP-4-dehydrorhamnose 3,5-epimerase